MKNGRKDAPAGRDLIPAKNAALSDSRILNPESDQYRIWANPAQQMADPFDFDAPEYYNLNDPSCESSYVNNADGYFSTPVKEGDKENTIHYEEYAAMEEDRMNKAIRDSIVNSKPMRVARKSSTLMKPTTSSMAKSKQVHPTAKVTKPKSKQLTIPMSPKFHQIHHHRGEKLSATSRELSQVQEQMKLLQKQKQRTERYRRTHQAPVPVVKQSKKLTVPESPQLQTAKRLMNLEPKTDQSPLGYVRAEKLVERGLPSEKSAAKPLRLTVSVLYLMLLTAAATRVASADDFDASKNACCAGGAQAGATKAQNIGFDHGM